MKVRTILKAMLLIAVLIAISAGFMFADFPKQKVNVKVAIVTPDLTLKPVMKRKFIVRKVSDKSEVLTFTTDFSGNASFELEMGNYEVEIEKPLRFKNQEFYWKVEFLVIDKPVNLELSNDNAQIKKMEAPVEGVENAKERFSSEAKIINRIYSIASKSTFKIFAEDCSGTGFLIDKRGIILVNYHVVANSENFIAAKISEKLKYPVKLISGDKDGDVAILLINPKAVENISPLPLAEDSIDKPAVSVGETIVTVGSPLTTENILTKGIVSKVEESAIFSDIDINPGNSGGPAFDLNGKVVGITTFKIGILGSGISGIVRIKEAKKLLLRSKEKIDELISNPPPLEKLPVVSSFRFSPEDYRRICYDRKIKRGFHIPLVGKRKSPEEKIYKLYQDKAKSYDIVYDTPVKTAWIRIIKGKRLAEKLAKHKKSKVEDAGRHIQMFDWEKYGGVNSPVVSIRVFPKLKETFGSVLANTFLGTRVNLRFKGSISRLELLKNGEVVKPILPGRDSFEVEKENAYYKVSDATYFAVYQYPPEIFNPENKLTLRIYDEKKAEPIVHVIPKKIQMQIWSDFEPVIDEIVEGYK